MILKPQPVSMLKQASCGYLTLGAKTIMPQEKGRQAQVRNKSKRLQNLIKNNTWVLDRILLHLKLG